MEDIKITEGTILESLNNKADIDGGNYKGSGLQAVLEETTLGTAGGTVTGSLEVVSGFYTKYIEFTNADSNNGGYIDFHFNGGETVDYTSRIMENQSGQISVVAPNGFNFPKCTTKATTTSSASASKVAVIVQNYVSGTSWYRVWSDGWIEQGGYKNGKGDVSISLLKKFTNTNYQAQMTPAHSTYLESAPVVKTSGKTTSAFIVYTVFDYAFYWYACGY